MTRVSPLVAGYGLWFLWGVSWLAAGLWRSRAVARAPAGPTRGWLLLAGVGFAGLFGERPAPLHTLYALPPPFGWTCVALVAAGAGFAWWARLTLGRLWSGGIVAREGHRIVATGPYAIVRHPIYTGVLAAALALAAIKATPLALAGAALVALAFAGKARVEERFLAAQLGAGRYAAYRRRVPMLVPRPRRDAAVAEPPTT